MPLAPAERTRLVRMLGMLASTHDGERASAALLISRMLREKGCSWDDVVAPASLPQAQDDWRAQVAEASKYSGLLTAWERDFVKVLPKFQTLSVKQRATLNRILEKMRTW